VKLSLVQSADFKQIYAPQAWNVRPPGEYEGEGSIKLLAQSIEQTGLLFPLIVRPMDQVPAEYQIEGYEWSLVCGFRRYEALLLLGPKHVEAKILEGTEEDALFLNVMENTQRQDLSTFALAHRLNMLQEKTHKSARELAVSLAMHKSDKKKAFSVGYINNLLAIAKRLVPSIQEHWRKGHLAATTDNLRALAGLDADAQIARWEELAATSSPDNVTDDTGDGTPAATGKRKGGRKSNGDGVSKPRPSQVASAIVEAVKAAKSAKGTKRAELDATIAALRWVSGAGRSKSLRVADLILFTPAAKGEE
jgi:ParB/RepB/Spo0J family partition protein